MRINRIKESVNLHPRSERPKQSIQYISRENLTLPINNYAPKATQVSKSREFLNLFKLWTKSEVPKNKANALVNRSSIYASAACFALANTGVLDMVAFTGICTKMCKKIFDTYGVKGNFVNAVTGVTVSSVICAEGATNFITLCPGIGNIIDGAVTFSLNQLAGKSLIAFCEKVKNSNSQMSEEAAIKTFENILKDGVKNIKNQRIKNIATTSIDKAISLTKKPNQN